VLTDTTLIVSGEDAYGCTSADTVVLTMNSLPIVDAGSDEEMCAGDTVTLSATGANSYIWSDLQAGQSVDYIAGNIAEVVELSVEGTDLNGCKDTDTLQITVYKVTAAITGDTTICEGESTVLTAAGGDSYQWNTGSVTDTIHSEPIVNTEYWVRAEDTFGCFDADTITVFVHSLPQPDLGPDTILSGLPVTLDAGSGYADYLWQNGPGSQFLIAGTYGEYWVVVTDAYGCQGSDTVFVDENVGIQLDHQMKVKVWPVPTRDEVYVDLSSWKSGDILYRIISLSGQKVVEEKLSGDIIYRKGLPPGFYTLQFCVEGELFTTKILFTD
ncbi:MAG: T9SS type A sorting domain-containing protein, partial [Bacteroidetes bacterium]|nr:T9SS type A sorting domain-containing protein [Bacteroidota bacterium]